MAAPPEQPDFARALLDPTTPLPTGLGATTAGEPPKKRFAVYRNNVVRSLIDALAAAYPTVRKLVGDEFFEAMAAVHVRAHPPRSPLMILYGEAFPGWLEGFAPAAGTPYLADVARLERARREAYHAADAEPLDAAGFAARASAVPAERQDGIRLALHPSLRLVASRYPIVSIWSRANGEHGGAGPLSGAETALVLRPGAMVAMRTVSPGAAAFLAALQAGASLGEAAEAGISAEEGFDLAAALSGAVALGGVIDVLAPHEWPNRPHE